MSLLQRITTNDVRPGDVIRSVRTDQDFLVNQIKKGPKSTWLVGTLSDGRRHALRPRHEKKLWRVIP